MMMVTRSRAILREEEPMLIRSPAFSNGAAIPRQFTCEGEDLSPPLEWGELPPNTRGLALFCDDPDAPAGTWHHWAAYDIPANSTGLPEGVGQGNGAKSFQQGVNDFGRVGYGGPCPPRGHGPHRYHFRLLALSTDRLQLRKQPSCRDVEREAHKNVLAQATLVGTYER
jgi:Raf kinase inhibitor-like YbhB/YbcL family protein